MAKPKTKILSKTNIETDLWYKQFSKQQPYSRCFATPFIYRLMMTVFLCTSFIYGILKLCNNFRKGNINI